MQSYFGDVGEPVRRQSPTSGAEWGNLRYGKRLRVDHHLNFLFRHGYLHNLWRGSFCDVGASRGDFLSEMRKRCSQSKAFGIEPDTSLIPTIDPDVLGDIRFCRVEDVSEWPTFDLIYMSHTLEHLDAPALVLRQLALQLAPSGRMLIEVPNAEFVFRQDVIEEFFIDKHTTHFTPVSLQKVCAQSGLQVVEAEITDSEILFLARLSDEPDGAFAELTDSANVDWPGVVREYWSRLEATRAALRASASRIMDMASERPVIAWGGGRIFSAFVEYGGLNPNKLHAVVDAHLGVIAPDLYGQGVTICLPEATAFPQGSLTVIFSRDYATEIKDALARLAPGVDCVVWSNLP